MVLAIDPDVFRTVFQISSFSHRKKLSDTEILQAGEYLLLIENDSSTNNNEIERRKSDDTCVENVAELECASNSSAWNFFLTNKIEEFYVDVEPKSPRRPTTVDESTDFVELSEQACSSSSLTKNVSVLCKIIRIRFATVQEFESYTLKARNLYCTDTNFLVLILFIFFVKEVVSCLKILDEEIKKVNRLIADQQSRRYQFDIDDQRRVHDYDEFTTKFFSMMVAHGILETVSCFFKEAILILKSKTIETKLVRNDNNNNNIFFVCFQERRCKNWKD